MEEDGPLFDVNQFFEPDVNHAGHVLTKTMRKWGRTKTLKELLWRYRQFGGLTGTTNMSYKLMMKKGHNVPLRSALANLLKRLEFITRRACLRGGMPVHGQDFASRCPALTMAMILNQYPKEILKQDTPEASQVSEASKDYALAFDLAVRKGVSMTPDEAFHFRVCLTRFLKVFDEWKVSDQPRIARELKLKLFTCALVRNRFTMLIDSNVKAAQLFSHQEAQLRRAYAQHASDLDLNSLAQDPHFSSIRPLGRQRVLYSASFAEQSPCDAPYTPTPESIVLELFFNPKFHVGYYSVSPGGKLADEQEKSEARAWVAKLKQALDQNCAGDFNAMIGHVLGVLRMHSVDYMDSMRPGKKLTGSVQAVTPKKCMEYVQDLCRLMMCNSQPHSLVNAQKMTLRALNYAHLPEPTVEHVVECYYIFFLYLRHFKIDFLNAKIQCGHYITRDVSWVSRRGPDCYHMGLTDGCIPMIQAAYKRLLLADPLFQADFGMHMDSRAQAIFSRCTFDLVKTEYLGTVVPGFWMLVEHKLRYVHAHFSFGYFALCMHMLAEKPECPKSPEFLDKFGEFCAKFNPALYSGIEAKRRLSEALVELGGPDCACFVMAGIENNVIVKNQADSVAQRCMLSGYMFGCPKGVCPSLAKAYQVYFRMLQVVWHLYHNEFKRLARHAVHLLAAP